MPQRSPLDDLMELADMATDRNSGWNATTVWEQRVKSRGPVTEVSAAEKTRARSGWDPLTAWRQRVQQR
jgi:hypothetical protein